MSGQAECRLAVDIGGTFTDVVLQTGTSRYTTKVLTVNTAPDDGVISGIGQVLQAASRGPADVSLLLHGTTLATNALIERKGARTALLTTAGFRDVLEMGFEKRFAQYDLRARRPAQLVPRRWRFTAPERISATGAIVQALDESAVREAARRMRAADIESVAVGFMHAYAHPQHEMRAAEIVQQELPDATVCRSAQVCPEMREYERFSTTVANAYVRPLMAGYLTRLRDRLANDGFRCPTFLMMSGGGLTTLEQACRFPIRLVESGPAGGAILAADLARARELPAVMSFDMGGTTAKICLIDNGQPDRSRRFEVAREYRDMKGSGLPLRIPVIEMVEIGAGGGSIARVDAMQRIRVGPDSAGSEPGPVCYGRGGQLPTVTDANLVLGKIDPDSFAGGRIGLDQPAATDAIAGQIGAPLQLSEFWPAAGITEIVEENMANAARVHAIERGKEPSEYTLIAFGGGAPLHAARLADKLGIDEVIVPAGAGVGSAIGFLRAPFSYQVVRSRRATLHDINIDEFNALLDAMAKEATDIVRAGAGEGALVTERLVELRYLGQGHELPVLLPGAALNDADCNAIRERFESTYQRIYGLTMPEVPVECVSWSVTVARPAEPTPILSDPITSRKVSTSQFRPIYDPGAGAMIDHAVFSRPALQPGDWLIGPAVIVEDETSTIVPAGFRGAVDDQNALRLVRMANGEIE